MYVCMWMCIRTVFEPTQILIMVRFYVKVCMFVYVCMCVWMFLLVQFDVVTQQCNSVLVASNRTNLTIVTAYINILLYRKKNEMNVRNIFTVSYPMCLRFDAFTDTVYAYIASNTNKTSPTFNTFHFRGVGMRSDTKQSLVRANRIGKTVLIFYGWGMQIQMQETHHLKLSSNKTNRT